MPIAITLPYDYTKTAFCMSQADVLQPLLEQFYNLEETADGNRVYSRTDEQRRSLLLYLLMAALIAEDYDLGARQFEALRAALKLTAEEFVKYYRSGSAASAC